MWEEGSVSGSFRGAGGRPPLAIGGGSDPGRPHPQSCPLVRLGAPIARSEGPWTGRQGPRRLAPVGTPVLSPRPPREPAVFCRAHRTPVLVSGFDRREEAGWKPLKAAGGGGRLRGSPSRPRIPARRGRTRLCRVPRRTRLHTPAPRPPPHMPAHACTAFLLAHACTCLHTPAPCSRPTRLPDHPRAPDGESSHLLRLSVAGGGFARPPCALPPCRCICARATSRGS